MKNFSSGLFFVLSIMFLIWVVNIISKPSSSEYVTQPSNSPIPVIESPVPQSLEVIEESDSSDQFNRYITGVVVNNSEKTYKYVQVVYNLYDSNGDLVGTALDNVNNLEPHGRWRFKALTVDNDAVRYRLSSIDGW